MENGPSFLDGSLDRSFSSPKTSRLLVAFSFPFRTHTHRHGVINFIGFLVIRFFLPVPTMDGHGFGCILFFWVASIFLHY